MKKLYKTMTRYGNVAVVYGWQVGCTSSMRRVIGASFSDSLIVKDGDQIISYRTKEGFNQLKKRYYFLLGKPSLFRKILDDYVRRFKNLLSATSSIEVNYKKGLSHFIKFLLEAYENYVEAWPGIITCYWLPNFLEKDKLVKKYNKQYNLLVSLRSKYEGLLYQGNQFFNKLIKFLENKDLQWFTCEEIVDYLKYRYYKKSILKRKNGYYCFKDKISLLRNKNELKKVLRRYGLKIIEEEIPQKIMELKGIVAYRGKAVGKTRIIYLPEKNKNFKKGEIIVSPMTEPDFIPLIRKASAIITDEGGITCHAAVAAREFKIPCLVSTKIATKIFKDGDLVEVNANKGVVRKLHI